MPTLRLLFPHHLGHSFVVAEAEIDRMPQLAVGSPLGELDLGNKLGSYPVWLLVGFRPRREWALFGLERPEQFHQARELFLIEPGARTADIDQSLRLACRGLRIGGWRVGVAGWRCAR